MIIPWLLIVELPLHVAVWGWKTAIVHTGYVLMCSVLLAELLLAGFGKIPFTCTHTASKDRVFVMVIVYMLGLSIFSRTLSRLEVPLLEEPGRPLFVVPVVVALLWGLPAAERNLPAADRALIFEDRPAAQFQLLDLSRLD